MGKILLSIIALVLAGALAFASVMFFAINNYNSYESSVIVDEEAHLISAESDSVRILRFSDVQTANLIECAIAYPTVKRLVKTYQPDLIILTGDNISDDSGKLVLDAFVDLFDSFRIPWALVFGNHDRNSKNTMPEICEALEESEFSIFKTGYLDDRYGNYYYNIEIDGKVVRSLIFMDSCKSNFTYEQVEWYRSTVEQISKSEGRVIPSFVFFHIPIEETEDAYRLYLGDSSVGEGFIEDPRVQSENTGFFDAVKELGSTEALFFGHDHLNNAIIEYEDVLFCYAMKTGYTVYYDWDRMGANLITVTSDGFNVEMVK